VYIIYQLETATEVEAVCSGHHHDTDGQAVLNPCKKANHKFNELSGVVDLLIRIRMFLGLQDPDPSIIKQKK
jgi:hypothetical protein